MTSKKAQRGPLLSSVFMVMLATAATGLLVIVGFQTLPESVIPSTFGGDDHESRNVQVTDNPATVAPATVRPTSAPGSSAPSVAPTQGPEATEDGRTPDPVRTSTTGTVRDPGTQPTTTKAPTKAPATTTPPKKTTSPSPTVKPTTPAPTSTTQPPSPAPTCGTGRKPRCPRSAEPAATSSPSGYSTSDRSYDSASPAPSYSETKAKKNDGKARGKAARKSSRK